MSSNTPPASAHSVELEARALALRADPDKAKRTYSAIAHALGVSQGWAYELVQRGYNRAIEQNRDEAEQQRREDLARIEGALESIESAVEQGRGWAIDRMVKLIELKAKLWGYYHAPAGQEDDHASRAYSQIDVAAVRHSLLESFAVLDLKPRTPELPGDTER